MESAGAEGAYCDGLCSTPGLRIFPASVRIAAKISQEFPGNEGSSQCQVSAPETRTRSRSTCLFFSSKQPFQCDQIIESAASKGTESAFV
ncbi:hypothetical protein K443DRAFT_492621 [Laccaria amethystina LaAM-08-1]|uniref:Uncharacterized protein n=1 Tax=Laccaria amethystina LaAM-08-1 TaxID=1095629 RepID=A0A0C9X3Y3_9AGAR|nr:hypothetical protein K443DRAFT_492621 [Laccaria amethystina LaAM-08-1]